MTRYEEHKYIRERRRKQLLLEIEDMIMDFLENIYNLGNLKFKILNVKKWQNYRFFEGILKNAPDNLQYRYTAFLLLRSRNRFSIILYLLTRIYNLLVSGITCTTREIYYNNSELCGSQKRLQSVIWDVCTMLNSSSLDIGIISPTKGLIAGCLTLFLNNHNIIDFKTNYGATLLPYNFFEVEYLQTDAKFVLVVEKYTVFEKFLALKIFENIGSEMILVTGKGFPDVSTRLIVNRLGCHHGLPVYILVDANPYGIEIMCVYRFGSRGMAHMAKCLTCPHARWLGIHPSELSVLTIPTLPLTYLDKMKLEELATRPYLCQNIRRELKISLNILRKAEIDNVFNISSNFLIYDYISNKINRHLSLYHIFFSRLIFKRIFRTHRTNSSNRTCICYFTGHHGGC